MTDEPRPEPTPESPGSASLSKRFPSASSRALDTVARGVVQTIAPPGFNLMTAHMDPWRDAIAQLERWHARGDRSALDLASRFLSGELPVLLSPRLARRLGAEIVRDLVQDLLLSLHQKPLPTTPDHPRTYLGRALQNRALSHLRRKQAEPVATLPEPPPAHFVPAMERQVAARQILRTLQALSMDDRVALKLAEAPEALDPDELDWLAARIDATRDEARTRALRADNTAERILLFEPAPSAADELEKGRAIDRFHKRVSRARQRLLALLGGER